MQPHIQLSVIIPTYKRLEILKETYSYLAAALNNIDAEIIIVNDDKKSDISATFIVNEDNTILVNNKGNGAASARNLGATLARGKLLLFIDDDILINSDLIKSVLLLHQQYDRVLSTPLWEYSPKVKELLSKTTFGRYKLIYDYSSIRGEKHREIPGQNNLYEVDSLASFCLSIKRDHYFELNGMDESFPYAGCEDQDFAGRAKKDGFKLLLDESNIVMHHEIDRVKKKNWLTRQFNGAQGYIFLCQKFPEQKKTALWKENVPLQKDDPLKLKMKKIAKFIIRQKLLLKLFDLTVTLFENAYMPEPFLYKLYTIQGGVYQNKGLAKSFKTSDYN
jgi:GT2 family glycosyltransferase